MDNLNDNSVLSISELVNVNGEEKLINWQRNWTAPGFCKVVWVRHDPDCNLPTEFFTLPIDERVDLAIAALECNKQSKVFYNQIENVNYAN